MRVVGTQVHIEADINGGRKFDIKNAIKKTTIHIAMYVIDGYKFKISNIDY